MAYNFVRLFLLLCITSQVIGAPAFTEKEKAEAEKALKDLKKEGDEVQLNQMLDDLEGKNDDLEGEEDDDIALKDLLEEGTDIKVEDTQKNDEKDAQKKDNKDTQETDLLAQLQDTAQSDLLAHTLENVENVRKELLKKANTLMNDPKKKMKKEQKDTIAAMLEKLKTDIDRLVKKLAEKAKKMKEEQEERENDITNINKIGNVEGEAKDMGLLVKDGDILVTKAQEDIMKSDNALPAGIKLDALSNPSQRWPRDPTTKRFRIPYRMTADISGNSRKAGLIAEAIRQFKARTQIDIVPARGSEHHILVKNDRGCYSLLGRATNVRGCTNCQPLSIGNGCEVLGTVEHEFMHALGFIHEQSRPDRDGTVTIRYQNIVPQFRSQFDKQSAARINSAGLAYDIGSIMQYGSYAFSANRQATIVRRSNGQPFNANRRGFSTLDVEGLNRIYPPSSTPVKPVVPKPGPQPGVGGSSKNCEFFARLSLCSYKEVCSACKATCTRGNIANPIIRDRQTAVRCTFWKSRGYCKTNSYVKRNCVKTCYRLEYPDNGQCR